ncbi:MAG: methyltransferase [Flavihumibacter sp.]|nr:methyltransferase [Flavihumibacter sp.]
MPNPYFQFKQFTIYHDRSTLKVSTDSCLLGAWAANYLQQKEFEYNNVLDIGAGTGLLMLMVAQQYNGSIDGIEVDYNSYEQATENMNSSAWKDRLHLHHGDIKLFNNTNTYDCIISNPPFFEGDLKSADPVKNKAKHDDGLRLDDLLAIVDKKLNTNGAFILLLPWHRSNYLFSQAALYNLYPAHWLQVRQSTTHAFFRSVILLQRQQLQHYPVEDLSIYVKNNHYTPEFIKLLQPYYLKF